jgi:SagB-type dehydrogenase family enzyme
MNKLFLSFIIACCSFSLAAQDIQLPVPQKKGGKPLMDALSERQTIRDFLDKDLDKQTLSNLLWAAYGFNRPDKRVVPSSQNKQEIDLYVVLKEGVYFYDAKANKLIEKVKGDHRKSTGKQDFVWKAPVNLIMVGNLDKASNRESAYIDSGFLVQNIYLFCASNENLGSVVRGYFDKAEISQLLNLTDKQEVTITQTVGYKK